jgi:hypothetical protein
LQAQVQLDASDDLQHWRPIGRDIPLVDLQRAGKRLLQRRLQVDGEARYLRVLAQGDARLPTLRACWPNCRRRRPRCRGNGCRWSRPRRARVNTPSNWTAVSR